MSCEYAKRNVEHPLGVACEECGVSAYPIEPLKWSCPHCGGSVNLTDSRASQPVAPRGETRTLDQDNEHGVSDDEILSLWVLAIAYGQSLMLYRETELTPEKFMPLAGDKFRADMREAKARFYRTAKYLGLTSERAVPAEGGQADVTALEQMLDEAAAAVRWQSLLTLRPARDHWRRRLPPCRSALASLSRFLT